jgi:hypothetical protein
LGKEEKQIAGGIPFSLFIRGRRSSTLPSWSGKKLKQEKGMIFKIFPMFYRMKKDNDDMDYIKKDPLPLSWKQYQTGEGGHIVHGAPATHFY